MSQPVAAGLRLAPDALTRPFDPSQFSFTTTDELEPFFGVLGQERAVEALQFGVAMPRPGYNVYVMGEPGTGRFSFVRRYLKAEGKRLETRPTGCTSTTSTSPASRRLSGSSQVRRASSSPTSIS